jgi:hypothetical protein
MDICEEKLWEYNWKPFREANWKDFIEQLNAQFFRSALELEASV